ncbi:hypothetical protein EG68_01924 [Paragonimus skrjabini miyazakii]|uniref:Uncharacterized protein n=1 Tax=Paragonimus skrjabini miyazakii TaxID=59628 RepID=A0A8S9Z1S3_9TREM|nr:hypothetical protein EG68_01924 [Paragonimus skrjabini miyazakii]
MVRVLFGLLEKEDRLQASIKYTDGEQSAILKQPPSVCMLVNLMIRTAEDSTALNNIKGRDNLAAVHNDKTLLRKRYVKPLIRNSFEITRTFDGDINVSSGMFHVTAEILWTWIMKHNCADDPKYFPEGVR